ncbi:host attachment family protein [Sphingomonas pituitosa]|uniref:host attachment family protein n=1 Tax=Sphingomonas pituitosa TaxID=99597 RepID=UPI0008307B20|nr:host attachment family protein [Sphingomonas pituitosa]
MLVPHDAMVVVADGRKLLMLRNQGDAEYLNLEVVRKELHPNPKDSDQKTDSSGRSSSSQSGPGAPAVAQGGSMHAQGGGARFAPARGTMGETDFHQLEEDRFAAEVAGMLKEEALRNGFESLIIIAPPKTLGELRKHYHASVSERLKGELAKDLTDHPVPEIEKALQAA